MASFYANNIKVTSQDYTPKSFGVGGSTPIPLAGACRPLHPHELDVELDPHAEGALYLKAAQIILNP